VVDRAGRADLAAVDRGPVRALPASRAGLPIELTVHCLRHSYVSHLIEDGVDPLFVQHQVGHSWASTTAIYTSVGADAKNRMLHHALARRSTARRRGEPSRSATGGICGR
jgi:integrase/recombinase XerC